MSPPLLGIGIVTCQRDAAMAATLKAVEDHTRTACRLLVADDGSTDFTHGICRELKVPCITGENRGVAWNKNRALFALFEVLRCDVAILLEDDARPTQAGWELAWLEAAQRWGHVNLAGDWFPPDSFVSGAGTPADPILSRVASGQAAAFSHAAISFGGYLDTRFRGYGFGHIEHSRRLIRCGFGGVDGPEPLYRLITSQLHVEHQKATAAKESDKLRNGALIASLLNDRSYRAAWADEAEMAVFRAEIAATFAAGPR